MRYERYSKETKRPYLRAFARALDYLIFYIAVTCGIFASPFIPPDVFYFALALALPLFFVPVEMLHLKLFGTTPGKALLGIHLRDPEGNKPSWKSAFKRSFYTASLGMGLGFPFVNIACIYFYFRDMRTKGAAAWDTDLIVYTPKKRFIRTCIASTLFAILALPIAIPSLQDEFFETQGPLFDQYIGQGEFTGAGNISWKTFKNPQGDFTINFPQSPEEENVDVPIPNSKNTLSYTEYKCTHKSGTHYSLSYTILPSKWLKYSSSLVLKGSLKYINKYIGKSRIISRQVVLFKGLPALNYVLFDGKSEQRGKLILLGNRLYKMEVTYPPSQRDALEPNLKEFLNSFEPLHGPVTEHAAITERDQPTQSSS